MAVLGAGVWLCYQANAAIVIRDDLSEDLLPLPGSWLFGDADRSSPRLNETGARHEVAESTLLHRYKDWFAR